ncbi:MAG: hypothetical protein V3R59_00050 [Gammaproteobacteria bacterium]
MNTIRVLAVATLMLTGFAVQAGEAAPAWRTDNFVMEEIVVKAEAPDYRFTREIDVTATVPQIKGTVAALEAPDVEATPAPAMEEIVVIAMAPESYYTEEFVMEELVITVEAPDYRFTREIVVSATAPQIDVTVAALDAPEVEATLVPVTEEIVATARSEGRPARLAARIRNLRDTMHF